VDKQFHKKDTTRTFSVTDDSQDDLIASLISKFGEPTKNTTGAILWESVSISELNVTVRILIEDGISTLYPNKLVVTSFLNGEDKNKSLSKLNDNQSRSTVIVFMDNVGENIVRNKESEDFYKGYLMTFVQ